ncbi:MAG: sugar transferase [Bacteroidales bacterium]|nr:sugar transferase [Bacteroidales bacterium]
MEKQLKKGFVFFIIDLVIVTGSFFLTVWFKSGINASYIERLLPSFLIFLMLWMVISFLFKKFDLPKEIVLARKLSNLVLCNSFILGSVTFLMYLLRTADYSRTIVFGTILIASVIEIIAVNIYYFLQIARVSSFPLDHEYIALKQLQMNGKRKNGNGDEQTAASVNSNIPEYIRDNIITEYGKPVFDFIFRNANVGDKDILMLSTTTLFNIRNQPENRYFSIFNLKRINDIRYINRFFETANSKLPLDGTFICCVETKDMRKKRLFKKYFLPFNFFYYYLLDYPIKRFFPKFGLTKGFYFFLTHGNNRVITRAETLGRLISSGFEITDEEYIGSLCYLAAKKVKEPLFDPEPSYGPLVKLDRIGRNGEMIRVLKLRTMYPFAEYLQDYMYSMHELQDGGKFDHDFRVSTMGKIMRRLWIDELPMLYNLLKGNMKLVGVRPLSKQYFNLYDKELQDKRTKHKSGLIPPFYYDLPKTLTDIQKSEMKYLEAYEKAPFRTDWKYFWKAIFNIVIKQARSN